MMTPQQWATVADLLSIGEAYEDVHRPFTVTADVPYTDVWTYPTVGTRKGKHPCEKPLAMMEDIIRASSRPGAVVLDCFLGSGVTGKAAANLGRNFIGMEADAGYFAKASEWLGEPVSPVSSHRTAPVGPAQQTLFA